MKEKKFRIDLVILEIFYIYYIMNLIITIVLSSSNSASRISNGILYPHKKFIPSENRFYLGLYKSRNRLRCVNLCQESSLCQTVMYDRRKQECTLFSEHIEYGLGRLYEENNENLITIRLDKDSSQDLYQMIKNTKTKKKQSSALFTPYRKNEDDTCENCEL